MNMCDTEMKSFDACRGGPPCAHIQSHTHTYTYMRNMLVCMQANDGKNPTHCMAMFNARSLYFDHAF